MVQRVNRSYIILQFLPQYSFNNQKYSGDNNPKEQLFKFDFFCSAHSFMYISKIMTNSVLQTNQNQSDQLVYCFVNQSLFDINMLVFNYIWNVNIGNVDNRSEKYGSYIALSKYSHLFLCVFCFGMRLVIFDMQYVLFVSLFSTCIIHKYLTI